MTISYIMYLPGFPVVSFSVTDGPLVETAVVDSSVSWVLLDSTISKISFMMMQSYPTLFNVPEYSIILIDKTEKSCITCLVFDSDVCNCLYHDIGIIHFLIKFSHKTFFIYFCIYSCQRRFILGYDICNDDTMVRIFDDSSFEPRNRFQHHFNECFGY